MGQPIWPACVMGMTDRASSYMRSARVLIGGESNVNQPPSNSRMQGPGN